MRRLTALRPTALMLAMTGTHFHPDQEAASTDAAASAASGTGAAASGEGTPPAPAPDAGSTPPQPPAEGPSDGTPPASGEGATGEATGQQPPAAEIHLTRAEDSALDDAAVERIAATARERGLSQSQASSVLELIEAQVRAEREALLAAHQPGGAEWTRQVEQWRDQALADTALGATPEEREATIQRGRQVLAKYAEANSAGAQQMTEFLETSGLGNHPATVRFFAWLAESHSEGSLALAGAQAGGNEQEAFLAQMYPSMAAKS